MPPLLTSSSQWVDEQIALGYISPTLSDGNCMIKGLPGMGAIMLFSSGKPGTLVANGTVGIVEFSKHYPLAVGDTSQGSTVAAVAFLDGVDVGFAKLSAKVTEFGPIKILLTSSLKVVLGFGLPFFWVVIHSDRMQLSTTYNVNYGPLPAMGYAAWTVDNSDPTWNIGTHLVGGDSSSPGVTVVDEEVVLLCTANSAGAGSAVQHYRAASEALWHSAFGITDSYTPIDLSGFDDEAPQSPPDPPPTQTTNLLNEVHPMDFQWNQSSLNLSDPTAYDPNGTPQVGDTVTNPGGGSNINQGSVTCDSFDNGGDTISGGTFNCTVNNASADDGVFNGTVHAANIGGGTFNSTVVIGNNLSGSPTFNGPVTADGAVVNGGAFNAPLTPINGAEIIDGTFNKGVIFPSSTVYGVNQLATADKVLDNVTNGPFVGTSPAPHLSRLRNA